MHLVLGRDLLDRLVAPQRFQRHLRLEIRRKSSPIRHAVFLRYPVEYTLAICPIFWDHLSSTDCVNRKRVITKGLLKRFAMLTQSISIS